MANLILMTDIKIPVFNEKNEGHNSHYINHIFFFSSKVDLLLSPNQSSNVLRSAQSCNNFLRYPVHKVKCDVQNKEQSKRNFFSQMEPICTKYQILFSNKKKLKIFQMLSAENFTQSAKHQYGFCIPEGEVSFSSTMTIQLFWTSIVCKLLLTVTR